MPLLPSRLPQPPRTPVSRRPLHDVRKAAQARVAADRAYDLALRAAREAGLTYELIAQAAGTTRSAIHNYLNRRGQI